jgi:hypothetical protein
MNAKERKQLKLIASKLKVIFDELESMAEEIERHQFKKSTQRSPEWRGGANY